MVLNRIETTYRQLRDEGHPPLKLFSGNPNDEGFQFPPKVLQRVYQDYLESQDYHPHSKGLLEARQAIQNYYASHNVVVDLENILLTSGTSESFFYLFSLLCQPGDHVLTPNPSYPLFEHIAQLARIELRPYHLDEDKNWAVDIEDLQRQTNHRTKAIVLISPNNPTGSVLSQEEISRIVSWANKKDVPIICDEVFSEFYFGQGLFPRPIAVAQPKLCFTLNGISKMFALPGLKLGWMVVSGEKQKVLHMVDQLETTADTFLSCHIPIQKALPALIREGQDFLNSYQKEVGQRRQLIRTLLASCPQIDFIEPQGGIYLMARVKKNLGMSPEISEEEFVIRLMKEKGVFVHPGYFFDYEKGIHFVISFLTQKEKLEKGIKSLMDFLREN